VTGRKVLFKSDEIRAMISSIAESIIQNHREHTERLALVGIRTGGVYLMERIHRILKKRLKTEIPTGIVDITLYRDDIDTSPIKPTVGETELLFDVNDKYIILVDDVLYTGRTMRAAIDVLIDFGRPKKIEPAVLVEREEKYREIPIYAIYRGSTPKTGERDRVTVRFSEETGRDDEVILERR
jgi:pyrimidine operon attenuation protein/uracil phosphoribosyltransferase